MKKIWPIILCFLFACSEDSEPDPNTPPDPPVEQEFLKGADISAFPLIDQSNPNFLNKNGDPTEFISELKENGLNIIRLRLWVDPEESTSSLNEVVAFSSKLKFQGFKILLTIHYSDTWADPGHQEKPESWKGLDFPELGEMVRNYTQEVVSLIKPEYVQIGNEINSGLLHPEGNIVNTSNFKQLVEAGIQGVNDSGIKSKIILHFAGIDGSDWFYSIVDELDYDIMGLSYYPIWHGKNLNQVETELNNLINTFDRDLMIVETAYPFTLGYNDWTNNIVGLEEQLILPDYPASPEGQKKFIRDLRAMVENMDRGIGICYWGAELIAWNGNQSTEGSPWENQAFFDFDNKALPVLSEFAE